LALFVAQPLLAVLFAFRTACAALARLPFATKPAPEARQTLAQPVNAR